VPKIISIIDKKIIPFFLINLINIYKFLRKFFPKTCRFYPSCSEYAIIAFQKKGFIKGTYFTLKRLAKCHPFCEGGIDFLE
jgi:hypothetical protein